jgi:hypothetical protein
MEDCCVKENILERDSRKVYSCLVKLLSMCDE